MGSSAARPFWLRHSAWVFVALAVLLVVVVRVRLREMPLERDEGEYAYAGQLMLQGVPPYKEAFNMKLPGTYAAYAAVLAVFGQTPSGVHLGVTVVNCASIVLVFLIGRRVLDTVAAGVAATCFALMSLSPYLLGLAGHATHFLTFFAVAGIYLLLRVSAAPRLGTALAAGVCLGGAFLMKQHGLFFILFGLIYFTWVWIAQRRHTALLEARNRVGGRARKVVTPSPRASSSAAGSVQASAPVRRLSHLAAGKLQQAATERQFQSTPIMPSPAEPSPAPEPPQTPAETAPRSVPSETREKVMPREEEPLNPAGGASQQSLPTPIPVADFSAEEEIAESRRLGQLLWRCLAVLVGGLLLPYVLTCLFLWLAGVFPDFWFWTVSYAGKYATALPLEQGLRLLRNMMRVVSSPDLPLWLLPVAGALFIWWDKRLSVNTKFLLLVLAVCSAGSVSVGFYFREHYFIPLLPVLGLFSGLAVSRGVYLLRHDRSLELFLAIPVLLLFGGGLVASLIGNGGVWFAMTPEQANRYVYGSTLFQDTAKAAAFIKENSQPGDRIAVLGSEPQIFFYANRLSASGFIYMYPLMEAHSYAEQMQRDFIKQMEKVKPEWYVFVNDGYSWLPSEKSPKLINEWWTPFWQANLDPVMSFKIEKGFEQLSSLPVLEEKIYDGDGRNSVASQIMIFRAKQVTHDSR